VRKQLAPELEAARVGGNPGDGPLGAFEVVHPDSGRTLRLIASDDREWAEAFPDHPTPWEHVSVSTRAGVVPPWDVMCWVKDQFWEDTEWVIQFHPAAADYVNVHPGVLHLWRPVGVELPKPPRAAV
jgi:hypothetical protein